MINKIKLLPLWCLNNTYPAFYDTDSKTAVEQTARVYGAMRELQESYNKFVTEVNKTITAFIDDVNADQEEFENKITKIVHDYIAMLDEKIKLQDQKIDDFDKYIKETLVSEINHAIEQMRINGEFNEIVLGVFKEIETQIADLQTNISKMETQILNNVEERLSDIESNISNYSYNSNGKTLIIGRGVLNE